jgi:hypothetical protein
MLNLNERQWLQETRRHIRIALVKAELGDWDAVITVLRPIVQTTATNNITPEVTNLLASLTAAEPLDLRSNAAMRAAAIRRLEETKTLIGELLVATTDH